TAGAGAGVGACTSAVWPPPPRLLRFGGRSSRLSGALLSGPLLTAGAGAGVGACTSAVWPPPPRLLRFEGRSERPVGASVGGGLVTVGDGVCCRRFPGTFSGGKLESAFASRPGGAW